MFRFRLWQSPSRFGGAKFCRVHKNQAVNLLQIPIHGQNDGLFIGADPVKLPESRITAQFQAKE